MLDEKLLQERLEQFNPEPLINYESSKTKDEIEISIVNEDEENINLARVNFLNVLNSDEIKRVSEDVIRKYGVGTCGPRAFYGTTDVHLELEEYIAEFLDMEDSLVYSYGFVTISSAVAAYCKSKDIVFVDKNTNFAIQQGLAAAKSRIVYFDHNDPKSFETAAQKIADSELNKKPANKFLVVEAVSWKTGKVLPLLDFLEIAEKHKIRVFLDETYSFGIFGKHGKGLTEHYNVDISRIDMIMATLESAVGSIGGFCAGPHLTIEHQRLAGSGFIFSASLPTYLAQACITSIQSIGDKPKKLQLLANKFHDFLQNVCGFVVQSDPDTPFKVFNVAAENDSIRAAKEKKVHEYCTKNGIYFINKEDSLVMNLNVALLDEKHRYEKVLRVLEEAAML